MGGVLSHRWMPLEGLSHSEQLAVFLNLYHVMLLHAFFILGPPGSPLRYVRNTIVAIALQCLPRDCGLLLVGHNDSCDCCTFISKAG